MGSRKRSREQSHRSTRTRTRTRTRTFTFPLSPTSARLAQKPKEKRFFSVTGCRLLHSRFSNSYLELKEQKGREQIEIYFSKIQTGSLLINTNVSTEAHVPTPRFRGIANIADYYTRGFSNSYLELKEQKGCEQIEIYFSKIQTGSLLINTNVSTEAHVPTPRFRGIANTLRMRTTISLRQWHPWTATMSAVELSLKGVVLHSPGQ